MDCLTWVRGVRQGGKGAMLQQTGEFHLDYALRVGDGCTLRARPVAHGEQVVALLQQHPPQLVQLVEVPEARVLFVICDRRCVALGLSVCVCGGLGHGVERRATCWRRAAESERREEYILRSSSAFQGRPAAFASTAFSSFFAASLPLAATAAGADPVTNSSSPRRGSMNARTARFVSSLKAIRHWR